MNSAAAAIRSHTYDNGLTLVTEAMSGVQSAAIRWLVPAGAVFEDIHNLGTSGVCAEMLMRGAADLDSRQQADAFDRAGALRDIDNSTRYMQVTASMLAHRIGEAVPLLADTVLRPRMARASFAPARELALQSIASLADDPHQRTALAARKRHLPEPYNRDTLGTIEGLTALTHDDLCAWWRAHALPAGSVVAVAGDLDHDAIVEQFGPVNQGWNGRVDQPGARGAAPRGYAHIEEDSAQVQVLIVHDAPTIDHPDHTLERLAISVLSGGMSGRLFTEVREKRGLCYAVSSGYRADKDRGVVSNYVGTTPERAQESIDVLMGELRRINTGDVTAPELARAKTGLKSRLVFSGESTRARAAAIATDMVNLGRARSLDEIIASLDAVTLAQLNGYLRRRDLGVLTTQTLGPSPLTPPANA